MKWATLKVLLEIVFLFKKKKGAHLGHLHDPIQRIRMLTLPLKMINIAPLIVVLLCHGMIASTLDPSTQSRPITAKHGSFIGAHTGDQVQFLGIKYATAGRFRPPIFFSYPKDSVHNATSFGTMCYQVRAPYSMERLFTNS